MDSLDADWPLLRGLREALPFPGRADLLEALEDWDALQGRDSWFIALLDVESNVIPGSVRRFGHEPWGQQWMPCPPEVRASGAIKWQAGGKAKTASHLTPCDDGQNEGRWAYFAQVMVINVTTCATNFTSFTIPIHTITACNSWSFPLRTT